ncbi:MAG: hypothetical protein MZV64_73035 [Ignavibacteriales bacterium]|nr:hypothetical protein [Ignavibacteriales bacterium]
MHDVEASRRSGPRSAATPARFQAQASGRTGTRRSTNVAPFNSRTAAGAGRSRHEELQRVSATPAAAGSPSAFRFKQAEGELVHPLADTGAVAQGRPVVEQQVHHGACILSRKTGVSSRGVGRGVIRPQLVDCQ